MGKTVAAVVVTYNRLDLLKECIDSLRNQSRKPDAIIVVNNGSTDGTELWLASQAGLVIYNQQNVGGAGGFNRGMKEAFEANFDWIWVMDDDGYPSLNCLEELLAASVKKPDTDVWGCLVLDRDDHSGLAFDCPQVITDTGAINWDIEFIPNWAPYFNGILFSRDTFKKYGYPNPQLFIWGDEEEYLQRTLKGGDIIFSTTKAIFYHPKDRLYSTKYRDQYVYDGPINWKAYCFFRNRAYNGRMHHNSTRSIVLINQFSYYYKKLSLLNFIKVVLLVLRAHFDGLTYNLKRKLPY